VRRIASILGVLLASSLAAADACLMGVGEDGCHDGPGTGLSHGCEAGPGH